MARPRRGDARRVRPRPARRPPERGPGGRIFPASPRISQFFQGIPNFSKEIPSFFQTFPKKLLGGFQRNQGVGGGARRFRLFQALGRELPDGEVCFCPPCGPQRGEAEAIPMKPPRRTLGELRFQITATSVFPQDNVAPARAARRRGFRARWWRDRWSRWLGGVDLGATRRSRAGRNGRLLRNRSELAARVYKRRRPVAGSNRSGRRHSPPRDRWRMVAACGELLPPFLRNCQGELIGSTVECTVMSGRRPLSRVSLRLCERLGCGHVFGLLSRG